MSAKRDLEKALKENGFRQVPTGGRRIRHQTYTDGKRTIRMHIGDTISSGLYRKMLGQIKYGSSRDGKAG